MKKKVFISIIGAILLLAGAGLALYFWAQPAAAPAPDTTKTNTESKQETPAFDKNQYSLSDPTSLWIVVNKTRPLTPQNYVPSDLVLPNVSQRIPGVEQMKMRAEAATALEALVAGASAAGYQLQITTAYRGYSYQKGLYDGYVADQGQAEADKQSARPGYSEHQTGWAVDLRSATTPNHCYLEACFGEMAEGKWLAAHAYEYGFLLRYPADKTAVTGYSYEPWHFRYIGRELALEMHDQGITTLEEFFNLPAAPDYQ